MTLLDADVARLKCVAFDKIYNHISCFSFSEDCCSTEAKQALAATLYESTCNLSTDTECSIDDLSNTERESCTFTSTPCNAQINITVTSTPSTCPYTVTLQNDINKTNKVFLNLFPNEIYQKGYIRPVALSKCFPVSAPYSITGCYPIGSCLQTYDMHAQSYFKLDIGTQINGYFSSIKLFTTDANGAGPITPLTVDISPANLATWTSCASCEAITSTDLQFGSLFFPPAFTKLLKNISRTLYGGVYIDPVITKINSGTGKFQVYVGTRVKHQPSQRWMGINADSSQMSWVNNAGTNINVIHIPRVSVLVEPKGGLIANDFTLYTSCGPIAGTLSSNNLDFPLNTDVTNFNNLVYYSQFSNNAPTLTTNPSSLTCTETILTATVTADRPIISTQWFDAANSVISSTNSVLVDLGDYYFRVTTNNGCVKEYHTKVL